MSCALRWAESAAFGGAGTGAGDAPGMVMEACI